MTINFYVSFAQPSWISKLIKVAMVGKHLIHYRKPAFSDHMVSAEISRGLLYGGQIEAKKAVILILLMMNGNDCSITPKTRVKFEFGFCISTRLPCEQSPAQKERSRALSEREWCIYLRRLASFSTTK
jgi:hypothetical protein